MDTTCETTPALPPPMPARLSTPPLLPRMPGLAGTLGFIVLYFLLQFVAGFVAGLAVAVAIVIKIVFLHGVTGMAGMGHQIQTALIQPDTQAWLTIITLIASAVTMLWQARKRWPQMWSKAQPPGFGFVMPTVPAFFAVAIALGIAVPVLGGLLTQLLAGHRPLQQDIQQLGVHSQLASRIALALVIVTLGPLVEELLFRGMLLSALMRRLRVGWAVLISSLVFVLIHLPGLQLQWYALPDLLLLALAVSWIRLRSGSIWPAVLTHGINNALAVLFWFVAFKPPG